MMGIGLFIIVVAWVRPAGYWEVGSVVLLRELLGDRWVIYLYVLIGVGFAAIAILAQIG